MNGSANTLACYKTPTITALKSFIVQAPFMASCASTMVEHLTTDLEFWGSSQPAALPQACTKNIFMAVIVDLL